MEKDLIIYFSSLILSIIVIFVPIIIYIEKKITKDVLGYLRLKRNWKKGVLIGSVLSFVYIASLFLKGRVTNTLDLNLNIGVRWLYGFSVGFIEEIPFRGFLLNKFQDRLSFIASNILVTIIFVVLHFPTWIATGQNLLQNSISIGAVSLAYGYLVKEYDSLWISIICHSVFNLGVWIGL